MKQKDFEFWLKYDFKKFVIASSGDSNLIVPSQSFYDFDFENDEEQEDEASYPTEDFDDEFIDICEQHPLFYAHICVDNIDSDFHLTSFTQLIALAVYDGVTSSENLHIQNLINSILNLQITFDERKKEIFITSILKNDLESLAHLLVSEGEIESYCCRGKSTFCVLQQLMDKIRQPDTEPEIVKEPDSNQKSSFHFFDPKWHPFSKN